jgi:hypothetical protein
MFNTMHQPVCIAINALAFNFFIALIYKVNVPVFDKQQGKHYKNTIEHLSSPIDVCILASTNTCIV